MPTDLLNGTQNWPFLEEPFHLFIYIVVDVILFRKSITMDSTPPPPNHFVLRCSGYDGENNVWANDPTMMETNEPISWL